jgi:hypothetical protein
VDFELPPGRASGWTTGYIATMLAPCAAARAAVQRAGHWLMAIYRPGQGWAHRQPMPAGWGYNEKVPPDCDSTAWALLALDGAGLPPTDGMRWALTGYRRFNGLYQTYTHRPPGDMWTDTHVDVTVVALQALLTMGTAEARSIEVTVERLLELADQDGWHAYWWADDTYVVAQALQALAEFERWCARTGYGDADPATRTRVDALRRGVAGVLDAYRQQREWVAAGRDPFGAALRLRAWASMGGALPAARAPAELLLASQAPDGGWPGGPKLRETYHEIQQPWATADSGVLYADFAGLFTTATVVGALQALHERLVAESATSRPRRS